MYCNNKKRGERRGEEKEGKGNDPRKKISNPALAVNIFAVTLTTVINIETNKQINKQTMRRQSTPRLLLPGRRNYIRAVVLPST